MARGAIAHSPWPLAGAHRDRSRRRRDSDTPGHRIVRARRSDRAVAARPPAPARAQPVERAIRNPSRARNMVLDPFGGSGTTLIACEKTCGHQARLVELDPA